MLAGIVLYNPEIERLKQNVQAILPQVNRLVLVDNGSRNIDNVRALYEQTDKIVVIEFEENIGVAAAQNRICQYAKDNESEWAIILDQDSICPSNIVSEYQKLVNCKDVGMICPKVIDRNFGEITYGIDHTGVEEVEQCIASASAIRISAWQVVGGFYEPLFIDSVDFDICWSLREHGYKILRNNDVKLLHEVGHSRIVHFAGKPRQIFNHSPLRYYYMIRNGFITGRRHHRLLRNLRASVRLIYQINRYESNRYEKNKMLFIGFFHGFIGKTGKYGK